MLSPDGAADAAPDAPVRNDDHPFRLAARHQIPENGIRHVLVENALVAEPLQVEFQALQLDTRFRGDVTDGQCCEVGLACVGAEARELLHVMLDQIVARRLRVRKGQ